MARNPQQRSMTLWVALCAAAVAFAIVADAQAQGIRVTPRPAGVAMPKKRVIAQPRKAVAAKNRGEPEDAVERVFLPADRRTLKKLAESRKLISEGRFAEAVRNLDAILESPDDFFFEPDKNSGRSRGLKAEAQRLIGQMPREGCELYELQYGARARQMLNTALETGDAAQMSEVSRRYFHTRSGYEATFLLGLHHFDHGRPLAGALILQRLFDAGQSMEEFEPSLSLTSAACWLRAGMPDAARERLVSLRERHPSLRVAIAGREIPLFTDNSDAVDWLVRLIGTQPSATGTEADSWLMFRGDAARNATTAGSAPLLNLRWRVTSTDDPQAEKSLEQCQKWYSEFGSPTIPSVHPLAVGNVLLMRTMQNLLAVDLLTGKRLWEVPVDDPLEVVSGNAVDESRIRQAMNASGVGQRIWNDLTYGTFSSDGRYVFSVEDAGSESGASVLAGQHGVLRIGGNARLVGNIILRGGSEGGQTSLCNLLAARDIRTGKLKWQIGNSSGPGGQRQPNTYFLGPPLPLQGQLYVLAEIKSEIRLLALEAATGNLLWSQQLAAAEPDISQDPLRRWAGVSPSYADGILVCPTAAGAVVAVELATRSLLWGYAFGQDRDRHRQNSRMFPVTFGGDPTSTRWLDDSVSISDGRVLATPGDSDWLYCISLIDGELLWKCARKDDLYVACADRDKVVLVGRDAVRAIRMSDGKPAWEGRSIDLPENSSPSGRGFASGNRYYLPLTSAEVAAIDLSTAKIVQISKSRTGTVPGNLICFKDNIVSQGLEGVDAYYQLDAVSADVGRRLATNANDSTALSLQGEILLDGGKRAEAIAAFRRAYELTPEPRTRAMLRDSLLDGLRTEFAAYRDRTDEIERLLDDSSQRAAFLRAMAVGLRQAGESDTAFEWYQKLANLDPNQRPLDQISKGLVVRRDRWIRGQLGELRRNAKGEAATKIDALVTARLQSAKEVTTVASLQRFFDAFGNQPAAIGSRDELIRRLNAAGRRLEAELASATPTAAANDTAKQDAWPVGNIEIATKPTKDLARNMSYGRNTLNLRGDPGPYFRDLSIQYDYNRRAVIAYDSLGHEKWKVTLASNTQQQNYSFNPSLTVGCTNGHLLLISLGWKIIAVDTLGEGANGTPRVIWTQDLLGQTFDFSNESLPPQLIQLNWQWQHQFAQIHDQTKLMGPVRREYACFQKFHSLMAVDPRNGETIWISQDVPSNSDLFGDDEYVFVLPPDKNEARVLRATDGEFVGTCKIPRVGGAQTLPSGEERTVFARFDETCLATFGRKLLLWWPEGNRRLLTLVDPFEGRDMWPGRKFAANARACVVDDEAVGVMEPSGRFVLISLPDGRTIADLKLEAEPSLAELTLFRSGEQYFLLTRNSPGVGNLPQIQPMPGCAYQPIYRGRLYAIDRQGKLSWPAPVAIKNQFLMTNQPADLPIVTFACQSYVPKANGEASYKAFITCIDKRTGRTAFKNIFDNTTGVFNVSGDAAKKTVDLTMQRNTIRLTFTDKPIPTPEELKKAKAAKSKRGKTYEDLWKSIKKAVGAEDDLDMLDE